MDDLIKGQEVMLRVWADDVEVAGLKPMSLEIDWTGSKCLIRVGLRAAPGIPALIAATLMRVSIKMADAGGRVTDLSWPARLVTLDVPGRRDPATLTLEAIGGEDGPETYSWDEGTPP